MEVHHHPHVEKKNFKEYFLEFLMIFLAVTMGFIAENIREHLSDQSKEREYIGHIRKDLMIDTASLNIWILAESESIANFDTLISILQHPENTDCGSEMYFLARLSTRVQLFEANDNTITELKNSGNFRLIRNQDILNGLIDIEKIKGRYFTLNSVAARESELLYPLIGNLFEASVFNQMVTTHATNNNFAEKDAANSHKSDFQKPAGNPQLRNFNKDIINQFTYYLHQKRSTFEGEIKALSAEKLADIVLVQLIDKEYHFEKE